MYAARRGTRPVSDTVAAILQLEDAALTLERFAHFRHRVSASKLELLSLLNDVRRDGKRVYGIGAPSRATTLVNYVGLDDSILDCVLEIKGSYKVDKYVPGTLIPIFDEAKLFEDQPDYALLLSWHIGDELAAKLRQLGYRGRFISPFLCRASCDRDATSQGRHGGVCAGRGISWLPAAGEILNTLRANPNSGFSKRRDPTSTSGRFSSAKRVRSRARRSGCALTVDSSPRQMAPLKSAVVISGIGGPGLFCANRLSSHPRVET